MIHVERCHNLTKSTASFLVAFCAVIFLAVSQMAIYCGFAPGWANGWPGGISRQSVFGFFMSAAFLVLFMSSGIAIATFPCYFLQQRLRHNYVGWLTLMIFALIWVVLGGYLVAWQIYPNVRTWVN